MIARDLWRIAVAAGCAALGVHPEALALGAALTMTRAWTAAFGTWRRDHPPRRPGLQRAGTSTRRTITNA
jgi:hypothetical protein